MYRVAMTTQQSQETVSTKKLIKITSVELSERLLSGRLPRKIKNNDHNDNLHNKTNFYIPFVHLLLLIP